MRFNCLYSYFIPLAVASLMASGCGNVLSSIDNSDKTAQRSMGVVVDDSILATRIKKNLYQQDPLYKKFNFTITVYNKILLLSGQVPSKEWKEKLLAAVSKYKGLRDIIDDLQVGGNLTTLARLNDFWLAFKVRLAVFFSPHIKSSRIKLVIDDRVLYIMGLVPYEEGTTIKKRLSAVSGLKKVVVLFEYVN